MTRAIMLTGTINPATFGNTNVVLVDVKTRLEQYEKALEFYIKNTKLEKIIFVENSGDQGADLFNWQKIADMALAHGKKFEFVPIHTDYNLTVSKGKSYGEADCIDQGVRKSKLLKEQSSFYKVTGRVIIRNIDNLLDEDDASRFVFRNDLKRCYTVFFKMNTKDFLTYFENAKDCCNENEDIDIETVYYNIIKNNRIKTKNLKCYPKYDGIIGTLGIAYNDPKSAFFIKNLCLKMGLFSMNGNGKLLGWIAKIRVAQAKRRGER